MSGAQEHTFSPGCFAIDPLRAHFYGLTSSAAMVRQGQCFLVSFTLTTLALWTVFRARDRFSSVTSRQISLSSEDTPSIWYSSKTLACREDGHTQEQLYTCEAALPSVPHFILNSTSQAASGTRTHNFTDGGREGP